MTITTDLARVMTAEHAKGAHQKCDLCGKQMCYFYRETMEWVCFTEGVCESCYVSRLKETGK